MINYLLALPRSVKRVLFLVFDISILGIALVLAFGMRLGSYSTALSLSQPWLILAFLLPLGGVCIYLSGLHRHKLATFDSGAIVRLGGLAVALTALVSMIGFVADIWLPRSVPFIMGTLFFGLGVSLRLLVQRVLRYDRSGSKRQRIVIYGAGEAGIQLAGALEQMPGYHVVGFVDDSKGLAGTLIKGLHIWGAEDLASVVSRRRVDTVALAIPSLTAKARQKVIKRIAPLPVRVLTLPSIANMLEGENPARTLRPISIDDILGRASVDLDLPEVAQTYAGKVVMVTGAGGSIGSELCRQLLACQIERLIALDHSEFALYDLEREIGALAKGRGIPLTFQLGSVVDEARVRHVMQDHRVQIVLHAAAYKHVHIVEHNEAAGLRNNVLGTLSVARAARDLEIERFILISTDKAVRPTNIMGASKRLAELVVQDFAARSEVTLFSMVRFGNVLGSSGSVIPLFERQIRDGGPVTVTHPEVTRYFMTISEASRLVLLAGSYSKGGDVFVLDMGRPVRIVELARDMVQLAGLSVRDDLNPDGDIEIEVIGMRPGEKLYEELLIGDNPLPTPHPKILTTREVSLSEVETAKAIADLSRAIEANDTEAQRALVVRWVEGYTPAPDYAAAQEARRPG